MLARIQHWCVGVVCGDRPSCNSSLTADYFKDFHDGLLISIQDVASPPRASAAFYHASVPAVRACMSARTLRRAAAGAVFALHVRQPAPRARGCSTAPCPADRAFELSGSGTVGEDEGQVCGGPQEGGLAGLRLHGRAAQERAVQASCGATATTAVFLRARSLQELPCC